MVASGELPEPGRQDDALRSGIDLVVQAVIRIIGTPSILRGPHSSDERSGSNEQSHVSPFPSRSGGEPTRINSDDVPGDDDIAFDPIRSSAGVGVTFASLTFFLFLPLVFALHWVQRNRTGQNVVLILASYLFYGWWDYRFCGLMLISSLVDFTMGRALSRTVSTNHRRLWLAISLVNNLGLLGFFKYFNFFRENFVQLTQQVGWQVNAGTLEIILPVGISFYTFQTLSYTIDVYRKRLEPTASLTQYLAFVSFFPQLVAGPIERATSLLPQLPHRRNFDETLSREGLRQILWGLIKKLILADRLAVIVDTYYGDPTPRTGPMLALGTICFAFQIYCDFSAYSDLAIGTARLFGIRLSRNFAYPYFAQSPSEFWRRWHISLSTWFRDYVYVPLGGNRTSPTRCSGHLDYVSPEWPLARCRLAIRPLGRNSWAR